MAPTRPGMPWIELWRGGGRRWVPRWEIIRSGGRPKSAGTVNAPHVEGVIDFEFVAQEYDAVKAGKVKIKIDGLAADETIFTDEKQNERKTNAGLPRKPQDSAEQQSTGGGDETCRRRDAGEAGNGPVHNFNDICFVSQAGENQPHDSRGRGAHMCVGHNERGQPRGSEGRAGVEAEPSHVQQRTADARHGHVARLEFAYSGEGVEVGLDGSSTSRRCKGCALSRKKSTSPPFAMKSCRGPSIKAATIEPAPAVT